MRNVVIGAIVGIVIGGLAGMFAISPKMKELLPMQETLVPEPSPEAAAPELPPIGAPVNWKMASAFPSKLVQLGSLGVSLSKKISAISGGMLN